MTASHFLTRRRWRFLVASLPILSILACSDAGTGADPYVGVYQMTQFAGVPLPSGDETIYIQSAVIELRSGGQFELEMDRDFREGGVWKPDPVFHSGNFSVSNGQITMNTEVGPLTGRIFPTYIQLNDGLIPSIWKKME